MREAQGSAVWALASRVTQAVFLRMVAWDFGWYGHYITAFKLRILQKGQGVLHQDRQRAPMPSNDNDPVKLNPIRGWHVWAGEKEDAQRVLEGVELRFPPLHFLHKRGRAAVTDPREGLGTLGQQRRGRDIVLCDGHQGANEHQHVNLAHLVRHGQNLSAREAAHVEARMAPANDKALEVQVEFVDETAGQKGHVNDLPRARRCSRGQVRPAVSVADRAIQDLPLAEPKQFL